MATKSIASPPDKVKFCTYYSCPHCSLVLAASEAGEFCVTFHARDAKNAAWFVEFIRDFNIANRAELEIGIDEWKAQCDRREAQK